jgi:hypothetical protein
MHMKRRLVKLTMELAMLGCEPELGFRPPQRKLSLRLLGQHVAVYNTCGFTAAHLG